MPEVSTPDADTRYDDALRSVRRALEKASACNDAEREQLRRDVEQLIDMEQKLLGGRVEIVIFGEISTGKSALINALVGEAVAEVDVRGGWTKEVWHVDWNADGYLVPGLADSQVVLLDTPGINEVGGSERGNMAREVASRADLILFVTDSDLNETEYAALLELASANKPIILVFNKIDLYSPEQRERLVEVLRDDRLAEILPRENVVMTSADPREVEYVIQAADGTERNEWKRPPPKVDELKERIVEVLEQDGLALLALNAAMYAADKSDRIATLRVKLRARKADQTIWSYAALKSIAVALNPIPAADVLGGSVVDASMVVTLAHIYGLEMSRAHAKKLVSSILQAAGWVMLGELATHAASWVFKTATLGYGAALTAIPQGAAAGYGSYIVGQAAKFYFEHGASWGGAGPKAVVQKILSETDKTSVLDHLKEEIKKKMLRNVHAGGDRG